MRIGILGGTFDPIHEGHLALAHAAAKELKLDRLIFVPAYQHPIQQKEFKIIASAQDRLEMVKCAIKGESKFEISDCEIKRQGVSYTIDTLRFFRTQYPKPHELFFITGGDWARGLDQWKEIDVIFSLAHFVVASRPCFDIKRLPQGVEFLNFAPLNISSTEIRSQLRAGKSTESLVPQEVLDYIGRHHLYQA